MSEIWKPVVGYEGFYEVSNHGRVRSLQREVPVVGRHGDPANPYKRVSGGKVLAARQSNTGYPAVALCVDGTPKSYCVHALVAEAFIGPRPSAQHCVNHIDADRSNNRVENLEWVTFKGNTRHAINLGTFVPTVTPQFRDAVKRAVVATHCESGEQLRFESLQAAVTHFQPGKRANSLHSYLSNGKPRFGYIWSYE